MRPLDPRLLRHACRAPIGGLAGLGAATAALTIAQAWLLAMVIAQVFIDKATLAGWALGALGAITVARAATAWAAQALAHRASAAARAQLRGALLARVIALGPGWRAAAPAGAEGGRDAAALTQLATTGLDGLDAYFTSYLPALFLAAVVPLAVLATIAVADPLSGVTVALTLPLVPLFGALIGMATSRHARRRWRALAALAHHFHDVVSGLPTLRVFGRADAQRTRIARVTAEYRRATMATLRLAFASSLALELIATMSVALVATEIGLRLAYGHLDLRTGLLVLILAPEAYLPLRALGSQFHATADGLAAAEEVFAILETPAPAGTRPEARPAPGAAPELARGGRPGTAGQLPGGGTPGKAGEREVNIRGDGRPERLIRVTGVSVRHEGRTDPAPSGVTFTIVPGRLTVLTGPSGCGKTTLLSCLLGFTEPTAGSITPRPRGAGAGWLPQDLTLFAGTVAENIRLGWPGAPDESVAAVAVDAALDDVGLGRVLGERGAGLSAGQRRRVALARALLPGAPLLLLDEPTAGLDAERETVVIETLRRRAATGQAVVVVSHRPVVIAAADELVDLSPPAAGPGAHGPSETAHQSGLPESAAMPTGVPGMITKTDNSKKRDSATTGDESNPAHENSAGDRARLVFAGVLGALAAACSVGLLATAAWLISWSAQRPPVLYLMAPAAVVQAFGLGRAALRYADRLAGHDAALRLLATRRVRAYDALARLAPAGLADYRSGDLIARLVSDIDSLADRWLRVRLPFAAATVAGAGAVAVIGVVSPAASLVLAATLVVSALAAPAAAIALSRREERDLVPLRGELAAATMELIDGAAELAAFGAAGRALSAVQAKGTRVGEATIRSGYARGAGAAVSVLAAGAAVYGALYFAVPAVRAGSLAGVLLAVVVLTPLAVHEVFAGLAPAAQEMPRLRAAERRVADVLSRPVPVPEAAAPAALPGPPYDLAALGLTAGWTPGRDVLRDVWFDIPAGSRTAVVGPSGSGKTTLAMVLLRFLDYSGGLVTLGGRDLRTLSSDEVRSVIGVCEQDAHVFDSTLEANLRLAKPSASIDELRSALARARLLTWVDSLPLGLATPVGEHGARLSGGQRQRLALARVLLADFPVVILDEPAEHLDETTADELTRDLLRAVEGRTVLLITHRPVTPGTVDQVLRLDGGRLLPATSELASAP